MEVKSRQKYTPSEAKLTKKYRTVAPYLHYDFWNCLLHARILCDRVIALSRHFLKGRNLPSFSSFAEHKKFFRKGNSLGHEHIEYGDYIANNTDWFDTSLKHVRDKFLVHALGGHMRVFGYAMSGDLSLIISHSADGSRIERDKPVRHILVSVYRLAHDLYAFLAWFAQYGRSRTIRRA